LCVGTLSAFVEQGGGALGVAGASQAFLLNELLKGTSRHQPCATKRRLTTVVDVSSCALSDVNAYGCQSEEQGEFISPTKTERKRICKAPASKNVMRSRELEQLKIARSRACSGTTSAIVSASWKSFFCRFE
jgi:hypothetical protein